MQQLQRLLCCHTLQWSMTCGPYLCASRATDGGKCSPWRLHRGCIRPRCACHLQISFRTRDSIQPAFLSCHFKDQATARLLFRARHLSINWHLSSAGGQHLHPRTSSMVHKFTLEVLLVPKQSVGSAFVAQKFWNLELSNHGVFCGDTCVTPTGA